MFHSSINTIVLTIIFLMEKKTTKRRNKGRSIREGLLTKYQKGEIGLNLKSQFSIEFLIYL